MTTTKNTTKPAVIETSNFDDFDDNVQASTSIAYCQIVNPPNLPIGQIQKLNAPYGIFVPTEQAEACDFKPTEDWTEETITFGDAPNEVTIDGYLTNKPRMVVIHRSQLEVQEKTENGWRFVGLAYEKGRETKLWQDAKETDPKHEQYRSTTRLLFLFLDKNNNPLHSEPIQLTARGGFGGSFGFELREFYKNIDAVYFKAAKLAGKNPKGGSLDDQAHALAIMDCQLGYFKPEGYSPFVCVDKRLTPAIDAIGQTKSVDRKERKVELTGVDLWSILLTKKSETGKTILSHYEAFGDFSKPNMGRDAGEEVGSPVAANYLATGTIDDASFEYHTDGSIEFNFTTDKGVQRCLMQGTIERGITDALETTQQFSLAGALVNAVVNVTQFIPITPESVPDSEF